MIFVDALRKIEKRHCCCQRERQTKGKSQGKDRFDSHIALKCIWMFRKARTHSLANKIQKYMNQIRIEESRNAHQGYMLEEEHVWAFYINAFSKLVLNNLNENQLKILLKSLQNKGGVRTECIRAPVHNDPGKKIGLGAQMCCRSDVLACKVLRWPDVQSKSELKALVNCQNYDGAVPCANPYHYSRITRGDRQKFLQNTKEVKKISDDLGISRSQASSRFSDDGFSDKDEEKEEYFDRSAGYNSLSTFDSSHFTTPRIADTSSGSTYDPWCSIAYWEIKRRVGRIFDVTSDCFNVFYELPQGDGMCLGLLEQVERNDYIRNVRRHIGYGFQLTLEHDGIWINNRSDYCVFVSAPFLSSQMTTKNGLEKTEVGGTPEVIRLSPGHCLHIVDFSSTYNLPNEKSGNPRPRCDVYCIRVSFAKGWGRNYTRQFITSCPCWTEIFLREPCLALMGQL